MRGRRRRRLGRGHHRRLGLDLRRPDDVGADPSGRARHQPDRQVPAARPRRARLPLGPTRRRVRARHAGRHRRLPGRFQAAEKLPSTGALDTATVFALADASPEAKEDAVKALQTELVELGLYEGGIDGDFGPATTTALSALQKEAGLPSTGDFDAATFSALQQRYLAKVVGPKQAAAGADATTTTTAPAGDPNVLQSGDEGPKVLALQQRLAQLGYRPGSPDGRYGPGTESAVLAFQKHEGLSRDSEAGAEVLSRIQAPSGAGPRSSAPGPRIEVDLDRQIAFVIAGSGTVTTVNVSTGSGKQYTDSDGNTAVAYTPVGDFTVYEKDDGPVVAPLGTLYKPLYFKEGWAMHGLSSVPAYPASHGCVRVSDDDQDFIFPLIPVGGAIRIYGTALGNPDQASPGF
ncbi:MAG: L,D-transpeptidase family protein [Acidimicrobiia bacterium]|nr:L,D-transpeptidase family protein [Acidimicrobiia bacterium]